MSEGPGGPADWTVIRATDSEQEAELVAGLLLSQGIETQVVSKRFQQEPVNFGLLGAVNVMVRSEVCEQAEKILREAPVADDTWELQPDDDKKVDERGG